MGSLKIVRGITTEEQIKSIDGLVNSLDRKFRGKTVDDKIRQELNELKQAVAALLDFLGLAIEPGPKHIIKRVRLTDAISTDNAP